MASPLNIVASHAQDSFLQDYRVTTDFFNDDDWLFFCAAGAADIYQKLYEREYAKNRADGQKDEVVAFSNDFLSTQELKVITENGETFAKLKENIFSFAYDQSNVGCQNVFCIDPRPQYELERSDVDELWQLKYLPRTSTSFWALDADRILLVNKGQSNVNKIKVLYVPEVNANNPETLIPDGIVLAVIQSAVQSVKELGQGRVVKKTLDQNPDTSMQTEANLKQAQP